MIVVLTANYQAGIWQFAKQIKNTLASLDKVVLFAPEEAKGIDEKDEKYIRKNNILPISKEYRTIASRIDGLNPTTVFVCDSGLITSRIVLYLKKTTNVVMCIHDANPHPSYLSIRNTIKEKIKKPYIVRAWKRSNKIILLSEHTRHVFEKQFPAFASKIDILKLGAHVPNVKAERPPELVGQEKRYILFFGRIDKYKGLSRLLNAYVNIKDQIKCDLVIAGKGIITDKEKEIIESNNDCIHAIIRYIKDEEMCWLFENTQFTVLPYIEASQSGVLSISYFYDKPVVVSNVEGLTEFVQDKKTGLVFKNDEELQKCMIEMISTSKNYTNNMRRYLEENLNWEVNIRRCLNI